MKVPPVHTGMDCIPPANLTKYIGFLLDGTNQAVLLLTLHAVLKPYFKLCSLEAVLLHPLQAVLRTSVSSSMVLKLYIRGALKSLDAMTTNLNRIGKFSADKKCCLLEHTNMSSVN